jgi:hypothetical protein
MAENSIAATVFVATTVGPDTTSPNLVSFDVDMATGVESVTMTFDETIDRSSLVIEQITLVGNGNTHPLTSATSISDDGTTIFISVATVDVDELKRKGICTAANVCTMTMTPAVIKDMAQRTLIQVTERSITGFNADITDPEIVSFVKFDFNTGQITLSFTEPVNPLQIDTTAIRLDANNNVDVNIASSIPLFHTLTAGGTASARGATIVIDVDIDDLNAIKRKPFLCKTDTNCYIRYSDQLIKDTFGNDVVAVVGAAGSLGPIPQTVQLDTEGAILVEFVLDLDLATLTLTFDEPVVAFELRPAFVTIQNSVETPTESVTLTASNLNTDTNVFDDDGLVSQIQVPRSGFADFRRALFVCARGMQELGYKWTILGRGSNLAIYHFYLLGLERT